MARVAPRAWIGLEGLPHCLCSPRRGTLSRSSLLVLLAGGFMGFSRELGSPEMVIIGRSITGLHAGGCHPGYSPYPGHQGGSVGSPCWPHGSLLQLVLSRAGGVPGGPFSWLRLPSMSLLPRYLSERGAPLPGRNRPQKPAGLPGPHAQHLHLPGGFLRAGAGPPGAAGQGEPDALSLLPWPLLCFFL